MIGVPGRNGVPADGYNDVAGQNVGSTGNGSFCISDSGAMLKCVDMIEDDIGKVFHEGPCGLGENNCAQYLRGFSS